MHPIWPTRDRAGRGEDDSARQIRARPRCLEHQDRERAHGAPSSYTHSIAGCLDGAIGQHGLSAGRARALARAARARHRRAAGRLSQAAACRTCASPRRPPTSSRPRPRSPGSRQGADTIVFFGIGGSSLGGQTLAQLGGWHIPGMADDGADAAARARASTTTSTPSRWRRRSAPSISPTRASSSSPSRAARRRRWCRRWRRWAAVKAAGLEKRACPSCSSASPSPRVAGKANGLRDAVRGARHSRARPSPGHRRPLLASSPTSACCRPWRAASMRAPCAPAPARWSRR